MTEQSKIKILHVEDNETNRYIISRTLQNEGFQVIDAVTGAQGLQILKEQQPDLVILDVQLPDLNGFEICKRIKANPDTAFIPVLHLSASFRDSRDRAQGLNCGADAYLVQPVESVELIATIRALLRIRKAEESALALAREWQTTFDSMRDGVGLLDTEGRFRRCNQAMAKLLGKKGSDIVGLWHQEAMKTRLGIDIDLFSRVRETGTHQSLEIKSGRRWFCVSIDPIFDEKENFTGAVYIAADITDRAQAEELPRFLAQASTVLSSSLDYQTTLENLALVAVTHIADWCVVSMVEEDRSFRMAAINHRDRGKLKQLSELVGNYSQPLGNLIGVSRAIESKEPLLLAEISESFLNQQMLREPECLALISSLGMQSCITVPLSSKEQILGTISLISAESGRRYDLLDLAMEEELACRAALAVVNASLYHETEKANRMKDEFLATLSHELRSPLNAMLGWISLLKIRKFDAETIARGMETIERNAKAQAQLVEDLLDVSRIIRGQLRLNLARVQLASIIRLAIDTVRPGAQAKEIVLQTDLESSLMVMGDLDRLQQIMWNLLSNAIKFTPQGGKVTVQLRREDSQLAIVVSDSGKGIGPEFLPYVFERFRQADSSTARSYAGLGLGLAIVRHLVELHGGTVHADSSGEGKGATFTVKLPIAPIDTESNQLQLQSSLPDGSLSLEGKNIAIVDDEADARDYLKMVLEQYGAKVTALTSAKEAIAAVLQLRPDVLVSDIGMPEQDGYAMLRELRNMPAEREKPTPALALTAYARAEDKTRAIASGFQAYLSKPVEPAKLIETVASLVRESKQESKI